MVTPNVIASKLFAIEHQLFATYTSASPTSLMNGAAGLPLLYYQLYQHFQDETYQEKATQIASYVIAKTSSELKSFNYGDGLAGVAFLFNYLHEKEFFGDSVEPFLQQCDEVLAAVVWKTIRQANLDYLHGALGIGLYLLERYARATPAEQAETLRIADAITGQIAHVVRHGTAEDDFAAGSAAATNTVYVNCGMAHGLVSHLMFLAKYAALAPDAAPVKALLREAHEKLRTFQSADPATVAAYPSIVKITDTVPQTSFAVPLGWCYGDTVVSLGLYHTSVTLSDPGLQLEAENLALRAAARHSLSASFVRDAGFCHGSASIAHTYRKWHTYSGNPAFAAPYEHWIAHTMELCQHPDGVGGFKKFTGAGYTAQSGLLDGAAGVALVLLDYLRGPKPTDWDRFFLLA